MEALDLIIITLATWRMAYLLVREDAPFKVMARIRQRTTLGGLLDCIYCSSIWTSLFCFALYVTPLQPLIVVFALSGGAMLMHRYTGGNSLD